MPDSYVYDKAKYHTDRNWPTGLPDGQALVHTGFFCGWLVERGQVVAAWLEAEPDLATRFAEHGVTGPQIYDGWDGVLLSEMLTEEGNAFGMAYFDFENGVFITDYERLINSGHLQLHPHRPATVFHVLDTWANYEVVRAIFDERYDQWVAAGRPGIHPARQHG
jgi:hypothetical protein